MFNLYCPVLFSLVLTVRQECRHLNARKNQKVKQKKVGSRAEQKPILKMIEKKSFSYRFNVV